MGKIVNRRNAILGWTTWQVGKRLARRKAKGAAPSVEGGRPNASAVAAGAATLAGAAGAVTVWRKRRGGESDS